MRTLEGERGLLDIVGASVANQLAMPNPESVTCLEPDVLEAVTRGLIGALRVVESCHQAADRDDAEGFAVEYSRLREVVSAISPLWNQSSECYAETRLWRPSINGFHYRSLHHLLWGEVRSFHTAVAVLACAGDDGDFPENLDPNHDKVVAAWKLIRRAICESTITDTGAAEVRLADELAAVLRQAEPTDLSSATLLESPEDDLSKQWESLRAMKQRIVTGAVEIHDSGQRKVTITGIATQIGYSESHIQKFTKSLTDEGFLIQPDKGDFVVPDRVRELARHAEAKKK